MLKTSYNYKQGYEDTNGLHNVYLEQLKTIIHGYFSGVRS